jgi:predicted transcriptional regulator of viral defense system
MNKLEAIQVLRAFDQRGRYVFHKRDMTKLFPNDKQKALDEGLNRLVKAGLLKRVSRGVYLNQWAQSFNSYAIEQIAKTLRRGHYSYVSLESMLSEYGAISQAPVDRLTVMTTGKSGTYKTPYGVIEFTHTKRSVDNILTNTKWVDGRPLRIAVLDAAVRDLKRVGRNVDLLKQA